jgi:colanic acid biosynthesis glycosyl transferase WcaI
MKEKKLKLLIYGINYRPELIGIGKYTSEMCEWLTEQGHQVEVITAMPYYPEWKTYKEYKGKLWFTEVINGVTVHRCPIYVPSVVNGKSRILNDLSFFLSSSFSGSENYFGDMML